MFPIAKLPSQYVPSHGSAATTGNRNEVILLSYKSQRDLHVPLRYSVSWHRLVAIWLLSSLVFLNFLLLDTVQGVHQLIMNQH